MPPRSTAGHESAFKTLQRYAQPRADAEQCEFCSVTLGAGHRHLLEAATGKIICVCEPCGLRFENVQGRWRLIPRDARALPEFQMTDEQWEALALPIHLAFFFQSSAAGKVVAMYPGPAGATESLLPLSGWEALADANPALSELAPDVEALLVNRLGKTPEYFVAPIDRCFELVGLIRLHWRGFFGGEKVWQEIEGFFQNLRASAGSPAVKQPEAVHA